MSPGDEPANEKGRDDARVRFEESLRSRLHDVFSAHPWVVAVENDGGALRLADALGAAGATEVLAVGAMTGGVAPAETGEVELVSMDVPPVGRMAENIHVAHRHLADPPPEVLAAVDRFDPDGRARVVSGLTMTEGTVVGRPTFGSRPAAWRALEDKLEIEPLWARAAIPVAPSVQVALADRERLFAEHERLATELGTVWAGDNSQGWHGGAVGTHWVPNVDVATGLADQLSYDRVRIMPFLEGVPCSIHGAVLPSGSATAENPDAVAAFRPTEMMVLRDAANHRLVYARASSFWDPPNADRDAMRTVARKIGAELRRTVDYRGVFTVDGVMTADGFMPTEVNTRYGAALASQIDTVNGPPLDLLLVHLCLVEGRLDDLDLSPIDDWAVAHIDANRRATGFFDTTNRPETDRSAKVGRRPDGSIAIETDELAPDVTALADIDDWVTAGNAGLLAFVFGTGVSVGPPTAPLLIEMVRAIDRAWEVGAVEVTAARVVR